MPRFRYSEKHGDLIGAHLSTKGGLHTVFDRVAEVNASAVAIFAKNSNQWKGKDLTDNDCKLFAQKRTIKPVFTHASYLINLATTNPEFHRKSIAAMIDELDRIIQAVDERKRLGICLDTCHVFASGYDLRTLAGYERTIECVEQHVGIRRVGLFHLNDSKKPLGSRVDRHEHIGDGLIGLDGFAFLLNDERFQGIPKLLETPKKIEHESDRRNLATLRSLLMA